MSSEVLDFKSSGAIAWFKTRTAVALPLPARQTRFPGVLSKSRSCSSFTRPRIQAIA
jgi:hypothetical protein